MAVVLRKLPVKHRGHLKVIPPVPVKKPLQGGNLPDFPVKMIELKRLIILGAMREYYHARKTGGVAALAERAGLNRATAQKLANGDTKRPAETTIDKLIDALDLEEQIGNAYIAWGEQKHTGK